MLLQGSAVAADGGSAIQIAADWLVIIATALGIALSAYAIHGKIRAKIRRDDAEVAAIDRFSLYFPPEGTETSLSVPRQLEAGGRRFDALERAVDELRSDSQRSEGKIDSLARRMDEHGQREEDLGSKLERLVAQILARLDEEEGRVVGIHRKEKGGNSNV